MAALTTDRVTPARRGDVYSFTVADATTCYGGGIAVLKPDGTVVPGVESAEASTYTCVGRFRSQYSAGESAEVESGVFRWENDTTDTISSANIGSTAYVVDDQTVASLSNNGLRTVAGRIVQVDSSGVWVAVNMGASKTSGAESGVAYVGTVAAAGSGVIRVSLPVAGRITTFTSVLSAALLTADATLTLAIESVDATGGVQTLPVAGSGPGVTQSTSPTALNVFEAGDLITFTIGGGATGAAVVGVSFEYIKE